jgi:hypothetical protein
MKAGFGFRRLAVPEPLFSRTCDPATEATWKPTAGSRRLKPGAGSRNPEVPWPTVIDLR